MSAIKLNSSGGGSITISPASTASTLTLTAPAQTGTIGIQGPAFSAYPSTAQSINVSTYTKINLGSKLFDTASCFNTSNSRFTPNVAGYYQITGAIIYNNAGASYSGAIIYKNGGDVKLIFNQNSSGISSIVSGLIYMNGTTDYLELYGYIVGGSTNSILASASLTYFDGCLVRGA